MRKFLALALVAAFGSTLIGGTAEAYNPKHHTKTRNAVHRTWNKTKVGTKKAASKAGLRTPKHK